MFGDVILFHVCGMLYCVHGKYGLGGAIGINTNSVIN